MVACLLSRRPPGDPGDCRAQIDLDLLLRVAVGDQPAEITKVAVVSTGAEKAGGAGEPLGHGDGADAQLASGVFGEPGKGVPQGVGLTVRHVHQRTMKNRSADLDIRVHAAKQTLDVGEVRQDRPMTLDGAHMLDAVVEHAPKPADRTGAEEHHLRVDDMLGM